MKLDLFEVSSAGCKMAPASKGQSFGREPGGGVYTAGVQDAERQFLANRKFRSNRRENIMKRIAGLVLLISACVRLASAQTPTPPAPGPSVAEAVKQLEHDWADAEKAGDVDKLNQILGNDWMGISYDGKKETKQSFLANVKSGADKIESFEFGPMDVKVLGGVAVVQGSDTEKSSASGKDTSGKWVWMDVFVKRDGKWVVVRSQSAMVK
jgi:ketosteroid isomerase-like protein